MAEIELTRRALVDLHRLRDFLAGESPRAAGRAVTRILDGMRRLEKFPESAPRLEGTSVRELFLRFGHAGYVVRYLVDGERVIVTRIFHARENRFGERS